jgi:hypothetical protein
MRNGPSIKIKSLPKNTRLLSILVDLKYNRLPQAGSRLFYRSHLKNPMGWLRFGWHKIQLGFQPD